MIPEGKSIAKIVLNLLGYELYSTSTYYIQGVKDIDQLTSYVNIDWHAPKISHRSNITVQ